MYAIRNICVNVSEFLPENTMSAAGESFLYTSVIHVLTSNGAVIAGALYGLSSLITSVFESVVNSLIRNVYEVDILSWYQDYCKKIVVFTFTKFILAPFFFFQISLISLLALNTFVYLCQGSLFSHKRIDESAFLLIV